MFKRILPTTIIIFVVAIAVSIGFAAMGAERLAQAPTPPAPPKTLTVYYSQDQFLKDTGKIVIYLRGQDKNKNGKLETDEVREFIVNGLLNSFLYTSYCNQSIPQSQCGVKLTYNKQGTLQEFALSNKTQNGIESTSFSYNYKIPKMPTVIKWPQGFISYSYTRVGSPEVKYELESQLGLSSTVISVM
ncbi:MAG TPA: hypothetical protein V6D14_31025 [Coleofasciculaceae cyanobacterium]|jgi:hypothetical protein